MRAIVAHSSDLFGYLPDGKYSFFNSGFDGDHVVYHLFDISPANSFDKYVSSQNQQIFCNSFWFAGIYFIGISNQTLYWRIALFYFFAALSDFHVYYKPANVELCSKCFGSGR